MPRDRELMNSDAGQVADSDVAAVPQVFLHIGMMKTGTSYLQQVLQRNVAALERDGVLARYANGGGGIREAMLDILHSEAPTASDGGWSRLVRRARRHTGGKVIISSELLSFVKDERAQQVVTSFAPSPVTVIITARDLVRIIPSAWQERIKHGGRLAFDRYVDGVVDENGPQRVKRAFWTRYDLGVILRRWVAAAGVDRVVLITVPGRKASPTLLWERFASVCGLTSTGYDLSLNQGSNLSLGYAQAELVRLLNQRLRGSEQWEQCQPVIQQVLARDLLRPDPKRSTSTDRPMLSPAQHEWAAAKSRELAAEAGAVGVRVVGSLEELVPPAMSDDEKQTALAAVPPQTPEMFVDIVAALVERLAVGTADDSEDSEISEDVSEPVRRRARR